MRCFGLVAILVALLGCSNAAATPTRLPASPSVTPTATATISAPSPTPAETATSAPTDPQPTSFESPLYPYALTLPPEAANRRWTPATVEWNGTAVIEPGSLIADTTRTVNGLLFAWGLPWTGDLASFGELVRTNTERHRCEIVGATQSFEVNGVPGLGERQFCDGTQPAVFAVFVKDGYGLAFRIMLGVGKETVALDDLVSWLDGLTWKVGE